MRALLSLALALALVPTSVLAQQVRDPLAYPLRQYGLILGVSLLGGVAGWYRKLQQGLVPEPSLLAFIGELATSAFSGLIAFWLCEAAGSSSLVAAASAGLAGHAGGRGVAWLEKVARKKAERVLGVVITAPAPLAPANEEDDRGNQD